LGVHQNRQNSQLHKKHNKLLLHHINLLTVFYKNRLSVGEISSSPAMNRNNDVNKRNSDRFFRWCCVFKPVLSLFPVSLHYPYTVAGVGDNSPTTTHQCSFYIIIPPSVLYNHHPPSTQTNTASQPPPPIIPS
jgi:hypothetical protein